MRWWRMVEICSGMTSFRCCNLYCRRWLVALDECYNTTHEIQFQSKTLCAVIFIFDATAKLPTAQILISSNVICSFAAFLTRLEAFMLRFGKAILYNFECIFVAMRCISLFQVVQWRNGKSYSASFVVYEIHCCEMFNFHFSHPRQQHQLMPEEIHIFQQVQQTR